MKRARLVVVGLLAGAVPALAEQQPPDWFKVVWGASERFVRGVHQSLAPRM